MNKDLHKIKKHYSENMMHLCRKLFPTILEEEGVLFDLIEKHFAYSKNLYEDIISNNLVTDFQEFIYSLINRKIILEETDKSPKQLLEEVGYTLYECNSEEEIQSFIKYYNVGEELCTFDGDRLETNYVFFAVKNNIDDIKRSDFLFPKRQDDYGTSVISIQFTKGENNTLSIKNRYNHKVNNPDATFSNNLENIIPGLTRAFEKEYNLNVNIDNSNIIEIPSYVKASDGKYYKYNFEFNNIYYGPNNIIIDNFEVKKVYLEKEKYLITDYFVIDLVNKKIDIYDKKIEDCFLDGLKEIKKIEIINTGYGKSIILNLSEEKKAYIKLDKDNRIIEYINDNIELVGDNFLQFNESLEKLSMKNVKTIGNDFCINNKNLERISLPNVEYIGNYFLFDNISLKDINFPSLIKTGISFIAKNEIIEEVNLPNLIGTENHFLHGNLSLISLELPSLEYVGNDFIALNKKMKKLYLPKIVTIDDKFLYSNIDLEEIDICQIESIRDNFLRNNLKLNSIYMPNLFYVGNFFLYSNNELKELYIPNLHFSGDYFLENNQSFRERRNLKR